MHTILSIALMAAFGSTLVAQTSPRFSVHSALFMGSNDLKKATNSGSGFALGGAYDTTFPASDTRVRLGLSYNAMPGKVQGKDLKTSLASLQLSGDAHIRLPLPGLALVVGLSVNKYRVKNEGTPSTGTASGVTYYNSAFSITNADGLKLGARMGFDYALHPRVSLEALYQLTELGRGPKELGDHYVSWDIARGPINPSWLQLGVRYHF